MNGGGGRDGSRGSYGDTGSIGVCKAGMGNGEGTSGIGTSGIGVRSISSRKNLGTSSHEDDSKDDLK